MAVTTNNFLTVAPDDLTSADALAALAPIDTGPWLSLSYTIAVITNDIDWTVFGANESDYSDEQIVQAEAQVNAGATGTYVVAQAPYRYYRIKIKSAVGAAHGVVTAVGIAKAS